MTKINTNIFTINCHFNLNFCILKPNESSLFVNKMVNFSKWGHPPYSKNHERVASWLSKWCLYITSENYKNILIQESFQLIVICLYAVLNMKVKEKWRKKKFKKLKNGSYGNFVLTNKFLSFVQGVLKNCPHILTGHKSH